MKSVLNIHWKDWCWNWSSNIWATWCEELTHWKKTLMLGGIGVRRRRGQQWIRWLDGITHSMGLSWVNSGSWWWTGRPGVLRFMESQRVGHDWATELNWTRMPVSGRLNLLINFLNIYLCIGQSSVMWPLTLSQTRTSSFLSVFICLLTWVFCYFEQNESSINKKELKMPFWLNNRIYHSKF